jgi:hypothetical protein
MELDFRNEGAEVFPNSVVLAADRGRIELIDLTKSEEVVVYLPGAEVPDLEPMREYKDLEVLVVDADEPLIGGEVVGPPVRLVRPLLDDGKPGYSFELGPGGATVLVVPGLWTGKARKPLDQVGLGHLSEVEAGQLTQVLRKEGLWFLVRGETAEPHLPGRSVADLPELVSRAAAALKEQAAADRRRRELAERRRRYAEHRDHLFVNPFGFVPLPDSISRDEPIGHDRLGADRLSGAITMTWESLSPLLLRGHKVTSQNGNGPGQETWKLPRPNGKLRIPGSTIKGAVRSLHETLFGGCLRVFDEGFVPVYRETASTEHRKGWVLGLVQTVDRDGRPTWVQLTEEPIWVTANRLVDAAKRGIDEQGLFRIAGTPQTKGRLLLDGSAASVEYLGGTDLALGGEPPKPASVALLREKGARAESPRPPKKPDEFWCATGLLTEDVRSLSDSAWEDYQASLQQTKATDEGEPVDVTYRGRALGRARGPRRRFAPGQVIWCERDKHDNSRLASIALSNLWRLHGTGTAGERVDESLLPCTGHQGLCISCRLFGSADTDGDHTVGAAQVSYRGHVRFGQAWPIDPDGRVLDDLQPADTQEIQLATTGAPRPGAGQFYLRSPDKKITARREGEEPARQWGAGPDKPQRRPLAGRKFYWHGNPENQSRPGPRHRAPSHQRERQQTRVELANTGTRWRARVHFENLDRAQLAGLLAALQPSLVLGTIETPEPIHSEERPTVLGVHLGGGKPFGLSSMRPIVEEVTLTTGAARYTTSASTVAADPGEIVSELVNLDVPTKANWPDLAAILRVGQVDPERLWYPPGTPWPNEGASPEQRKKFDDSMQWFKSTGGRYLSSRTEYVVPLPRPSDPNPTLPVTGSLDLLESADQ